MKFRHGKEFNLLYILLILEIPCAHFTGLQAASSGVMEYVLSTELVYLPNLGSLVPLREQSFHLWQSTKVPVPVMLAAR